MNTATGSEPDEDAERWQPLQEMTVCAGVALDPGGMCRNVLGL